MDYPYLRIFIALALLRLERRSDRDFPASSPCRLRSARPKLVFTARSFCATVKNPLKTQRNKNQSPNPTIIPVKTGVISINIPYRATASRQNNCSRIFSIGICTHVKIGVSRKVYLLLSVSRSSITRSRKSFGSSVSNATTKS